MGFIGYGRVKNFQSDKVLDRVLMNSCEDHLVVLEEPCSYDSLNVNNVNKSPHLDSSTCPDVELKLPILHKSEGESTAVQVFPLVFFSYIFNTYTFKPLQLIPKILFFFFFFFKASSSRIIRFGF
jgi:hypothetical protein